MSLSLTTSAQKMFDSEVLQAFQQVGLVERAVTIRKNVKASTYQFNRLGQGLANQKAIHEDATMMDLAHTQQVATMQKWYAPEMTDYFSNAEAPFDERTELVQAISGALGRRKDQIVLDQLADAIISYGAGNTVGVAIGGANTDLNVAKLVEAARILDEAGVPSTDRFLIAHVRGKASLLNTTAVTSADFNSVQALVKGNVNSFMGFEFIWISTRVEGGLPKSGNTRQNYAFHKSAVGLAIGDDVSAKVSWDDMKDAWLCMGKMRAGAVARDKTGMVLVQTFEA